MMGPPSRKDDPIITADGVPLMQVSEFTYHYYIREQLCTRYADQTTESTGRHVRSTEDMEEQNHVPANEATVA